MTFGGGITIEKGAGPPGMAGRGLKSPLFSQTGYHLFSVSAGVYTLGKSMDGMQFNQMGRFFAIPTDFSLDSPQGRWYICSGFCKNALLEQHIKEGRL